MLKLYWLMPTTPPSMFYLFVLGNRYLTLQNTEISKHTSNLPFSTYLRSNQIYNNSTDSPQSCHREGISSKLYSHSLHRHHYCTRVDKRWRAAVHWWQHRHNHHHLRHHSLQPSPHHADCARRCRRLQLCCCNHIHNGKPSCSIYRSSHLLCNYHRYIVCYHNE